MRAKLATGRAGELADAADDGVRGRSASTASRPGDLRELAIAVRQQAASTSSCSVGRQRQRRCVARRARSRPTSGKVAGDLIKDAAKAVGGGGGGKGDVADGRWQEPRRARRGAAHREGRGQRLSGSTGARARHRPRHRSGSASPSATDPAPSRRRSRCCQRSGSRAHDHRRIAALVVEEEAEVVVVGLPLNMNGSIGPAAQGCHRRGRGLGYRGRRARGDLRRAPHHRHAPTGR